MGYPPHNVAKHFRWISLPLYRWVSDRMFTFPPAMERWHETVPHTQVSHFLIIPHLCFYMNSKMTPGVSAYMGKWIPWRISTTRSPPLYLIFLTCQVKCVGFIWGTFHGFLSPKAGTGFIKPIVCKLTVLVYVIYKYHLFLLPSRVFVFFNLYYTILIKSLWNINT